MKTLTKPAQLSPQEHRLLGEGRVSIHPLTNCAPGTWGGALLGLARRGLMECIEGLGDWNAPSIYQVTRPGRDAYVSYGAPYVPITEAHD